MQETELHIKKRRKRYLTLLTVMLMMAGCGAGLAGSSSQALAKGESQESVAVKNSKGYTKGEHNATASWQNVKDVYDINSFKGWVNPGMDFDGYLQFPNLRKHPPKGFKYSLFGGSNDFSRNNFTKYTIMHNKHKSSYNLQC